MSDDAAHLAKRLRTTQFLAIWALIFGLGIGFYAGFQLGVDTTNTWLEHQDSQPEP